MKQPDESAGALRNTDDSAGDAGYSQRELERRVYHLKTLFDLSQEIGFLAGTEEMAKTLLTMIMGTFGSLSGVVALVDTGEGSLETVVRRGIDGSAEKDLACLLDPDTVQVLRESSQIAIIGGEGESTGKGGRKLHDALAACGIRIWIPLPVDENLRGGIGLGDKILGGSYTADDQELLLTLARQGAVAMENARLVEKMRREEIVRTNLYRYLSPQVVEKVMNHDVELNLGGSRKTVTILFSDIRDFTGITETRPPEHLVSVLNEYFTAMANCIFEFQGTIDKFIGDAIMSLYGSLVDLENPCRNAVRTAIEMMKIMPELNRKWQTDYNGFSMQVGIGITSGEVFIGNIGSPERMEYTAIGDTVNVASRFSGLAKGGEIIVGRTTLDALGGEFVYKEHPPALVKGKSEKMEVFEILY